MGTIGEASKVGDQNIKEGLPSRKPIPSRNRFDGHLREADPNQLMGKADDWEEETGRCTPRERRDRGPGRPGRIPRDNVRKVLLAAGADGNLQRLLSRGYGRSRGELTGLGHESVGAMREG